MCGPHGSGPCMRGGLSGVSLEKGSCGVDSVSLARSGAEFVIPDTFVPRALTGGAAGGAVRPAKLSAQAGYYCFDMAAPIGAGTFAAAVASAKCAVAAAEAVLAGERGAYALCRPPGHHAGRDYCGGFCYLNNAAIAAERLIAGGLSAASPYWIWITTTAMARRIFFTRAAMSCSYRSTPIRICSIRTSGDTSGRRAPIRGRDLT